MAAFEGIEMNPGMFEHLYGQGLGTRNMDYTWRDVSLYGIGVGAKMEDLPYFYERCEGGLKALPTFALLPYINSITMDQYTKVPLGTNELVIDFVTEKLGYTPVGLHMAMDIRIDGEIDAYKGTFITEDKLNKVLDRGEGKGIVSDCAMDVYDIAGRHVAELHSYHYNAAFGGFGGEKFAPPKLAYPDRAPDYETTEFMVENLAAIYRLAGDTYKNHVDPEAAKSKGFKKPFMMGLCTYGFATRMIIQQVIPYQPEKVTHIYAQIRNVCYPGCNVTVKSWEVEKGTIYFQMLDEEGRLLLNNGILEYKK